MSDIIINEYINKKNEYINEELKFIIKKCIKSLIKIYRRHVNMVYNSNLNLDYISNIDIFKNNLYIEYYRNEKKIKIEVYENIMNKRIKKKIKNLSEFNNYSFISIYINDNKKIVYNIFNKDDFVDIIKDIKAIMSLKILLKIKNIEIKELFPDLKTYPLELFYSLYFLKNKKEIVTNDIFIVNIKSLKSMNLISKIINK